MLPNKATPPFRFQDAPTGMPFLFKLKRPHNHIAGGGFFVTYSRLPLALAWEVFGPKNGAASLDDLRAALEPLTGNVGLGTEIGCTVLANSFFLQHEDWIAIPSGFASNIVRGKFFESDSGDGAAIWAALEARLAADRYERADDRLIATTSAATPHEKWGNPVLVKPRLGQSSFRVLVTDATSVAARSPERTHSLRLRRRTSCPTPRREPTMFGTVCSSAPTFIACSTSGS
jgi:putative restriction endonuclease